MISILLSFKYSPHQKAYMNCLLDFTNISETKNLRKSNFLRIFDDVQNPQTHCSLETNLL